MNAEDKVTITIVRRATLKFLGDEPKVQRQFDLDTTQQRSDSPPPPYPAAPALFDILDVLYQNSQFFWSIFMTIVVSTFFYIRGRGAAERDKKELVSKIREILAQNQEQIVTQLRTNEKLRSKLKWHPQWIIIRLIDKKTTHEWEAPLEVYGERLKVLLHFTYAGELIINILEEIADKDSTE